MLTLDQIMQDSIWVLKLTWGRQVGKYEEMRKLADNSEDDFRDFDLCCEQPEHLKPFFDAYFAYDEEHGFTIISDFYNNVWKPNEIKRMHEEREKFEKELLEDVKVIREKYQKWMEDKGNDRGDGYLSVCIFDDHVSVDNARYDEGRIAAWENEYGFTSFTPPCEDDT